MNEIAAKRDVGPAAARAAGADSFRRVETALDAALLVIRSGGSTLAAERSFSNILKGAGVGGVDAVWRLDFIAASLTTDRQVTTVVRPVGPIGVNLARASAVTVLSERAARGKFAGPALATEVERIGDMPSPYSRWLTVLIAAATAACFSQLPGGDWGSFAIAFVAAGVGQFLRGLLQARKLAVAPLTMVCGLVSALIAAVGLRLGFSQVEAATLIAAVIYIVPGLPLINGFIDMISHRHLVVGFERMLNAAFLFLVLAIAIALAHTVVAL